MNETINSNGTSATWTALPVCLLLACLTGIVGNVVLLAVFILHRRTLWTPFNVYVVNSSSPTVAATAMQYPLDVISALHNAWPLGERVCDFYIVVGWYFQPVIFNSHQLIALNRVWAVSHPISYRQIHSKRTAICLCVLCLGLRVYRHVAGSDPGSDKPKLSKLRRRVCWMQPKRQAQSQWALAVQIIFYIWPQFFMVVRNGCDFCGETNEASHEWNDGEQTDPPTVSANQAHPGQRSAPQQGRPTPSHHSSGSLLLILLTISVTVCWTPNNVDFIWIVNNQRSLEWFVELLEELDATQHDDERFHRFLDIQTHVTSSNRMADLRSFAWTPGDFLSDLQTRLDY
ncbi:hypothetical protein BV898_15091 [Hypsibius exemplaris]|uniref:G-protein coupled receptors family 1 profile domain-containing protein n=1 Tax=Hypsibius exemplaris TaxID=2072580 RepID=A0A9X6N9T4_HYPEX|nr:hypothetical protein BV898_15091 [Hypsibius exemplaris]